MTCDEIDPQQNDDMHLLMELSDEALEWHRGANAWISNSCLWILLLHLSSSFCIEDNETATGVTGAMALPFVWNAAA
jgi:hypothetical protein